ncbi:WD40-repeat-containing domain protein [Infundibulicybe gibba]|nr:WD40-repeat-containing domain protein [Infundibulicybe gibba]
MPEIPVGAQIFDIAFNPTHSTVYAGLLTGEIKAFAYNEQGAHNQSFSLRPSKRSCRSVTLDNDGSHLFAVGKSKALCTIDTTTAALEMRVQAHESPINRVKYLMPWLLSTGDDEGVIKLWDPRQQECVRTYNQHFDYITDFLWLDDKKQLIATSGDGTLSVLDVRSKSTKPFAQSEDQEDELLSIVAIKGNAKIVVGTQIGILSIFNRSSGWGDCVDRIPGHPHSIDALCALPPALPDVDTSSTILTGSSDGFVRAVQVLPTKLVGVVADHGEWPVERIAIGGGFGYSFPDDLSGDEEEQPHVGKLKPQAEEAIGNPARWWVGSVGHEEVIRLTDLEDFFKRQSNPGSDNEGGEPVDETTGPDTPDQATPEESRDAEISKQGNSCDSDEEGVEEVKNKRKRKGKGKLEKDPLLIKKKKGRNEVDIDGAFFDDL